MGNPDLLTAAAVKALKEADIIFGSERLINMVADAGLHRSGAELAREYKAERICSILAEKTAEMQSELTAAALFSGDTGFYSGAAGLRNRISSMGKCISGAVEAIEDAAGRDDAAGWDVRVIPGISSVSYLSSRLGIDYSDARILSTHGRPEREWKHELLTALEGCGKIFTLVSGRRDINEIGRLICGLNDGKCGRIYAGRALSYPDEVILEMSPEECAELAEEGMYTLCIVNQKAGTGARETAGDAEMRKNTGNAAVSASENMPGYAYGYVSGPEDDDFVRGSVPMTKQEIRHLSVEKLRLTAGSVLYDVGCGTGSVGIEAALKYPEIKVIAVDRDPEAVELTGLNAERLGAGNIEVIEGEAAEVLSSIAAAYGAAGLPVPTHVFIGGSGRKLEELLTCISRLSEYRKSCAWQQEYAVQQKSDRPGKHDKTDAPAPCRPDESDKHIRVVVNAISLETVSDITALLKHIKHEDLEIVSVSVSRMRAIGSHHLMMGENPVMIISFDI